MAVRTSHATAVIGGSVLLALLAGCGSSPVGLDPDQVDFADALGVDLDQMTKTDSGLYYQITQEGEGDDVAESGDVLTVEYTLWLSDGQLIDSSGSSGPLTFTLGQGQLISGFEEGVTGMRLNETRLLVVPYWLAYGTTTYGIIPAYSTIVFEVTLTDLVKSSS